MRILVVEDDAVVAEQLRRTLSKEGFEVDLARDGDRGDAMARSGGYGAVVLDLMLPGKDGIEVCTSLRRARNNVPILMLTARGELGDRVKGLDMGADDYLAKPFEFTGLLARLRAITRRSRGDKGRHLTAGDLDIDTTSRTVTRNGTVLRLTPREYELLEALARNKGRTLTREIIMEQVWGDHSSLSNTVNFHVTSLRKKIDEGRTRSLVETVHGFGYRISIEGDRE